MRKPITFSAILLVGGLALASCVGTDPSPTSAPANGDCETLTTITAGLMPISDSAPIFLGSEQGFFEDECIELEIELVPTGDLIVPSVVSGDFEFGVSNVTSLALARERGLPIRLIAGAAYTTGEVGNDTLGLVVAPDSDIASPADFEGKTVAISAFRNIAEVLYKEVVERAGGDPNSLRLVEIGLPDMGAAVLNDQVDVGFMVEPFMTITLGQGAKLVSTPMAEISDRFLVAAYFTNDQLIESDPDLVDRITRAITQSLDYARTHPDEARATFPEFTSIPEEIGNTLLLSDWTPAIEADDLQEILDLTTKWGVLSDRLDVSTLLR